MFEKGRQPKRKRQDLEEKKSINRGPASKEGKVEILKTENFEQWSKTQKYEKGFSTIIPTILIWTDKWKPQPQLQD